MSGLGLKLNFNSTRVLPNIELKHVKQSDMTYLGVYGGTTEETVLNRSKGDLVTPTVGQTTQNWVLGDNYLSSSANNLSAGIISTGQPKQLDCTLFSVFNLQDIPNTPGTLSSVGILSLWGDNPNLSGNPGRLSLSAIITAEGDRYIGVRWGTNADVPALACAVPLDWRGLSEPIYAICSRKDSGILALEVHSGATVLKQEAIVTPVPIPAESTNWRMYSGQLSTYPINGLRAYAAAAWKSYLSAEELSGELEIMKINLSSHFN